MEPEFDGAGEMWRTTLATLRERVTPRQFDVWFRNTRPGVVRKGHVESLVPSVHVRDWLERKYTSLVQTAVTQNTGWSDPEVRFVLDDSKTGPKEEKLQVQPSVKVVRDVPAELPPSSWKEQ